MHADLSTHERIVVLTGAGISAASGIRTFRGPDGVWSEYDVARHGHADALTEDPDRAWQFFASMRASIRDAAPNAAHRALARWESALTSAQKAFCLITQNVDSLHQRAGSQNVIELHGNIMVTRCSNASCRLEPCHDEQLHRDGAPRCPLCRSVLRPDVVLFGEWVSESAFRMIERALLDCDLFLAVGTSGLVTPAANFVGLAERAGARTMLVNLEPMEPHNAAFKEQHLGPAETVLPELLGLEA